MAFGDRKDKRVAFVRGLPAELASLDGSWRAPCRVLDISQSGARIALDPRPANIELSDFSLEFGNAVARRCRLVRDGGDHVGVEFVQTAKSSSRKGAASRT